MTFYSGFMFKQFLKKLPIISLWYKNVRLNRDLSFSEQQLNNAVEKITETHLQLLQVSTMKGTAAIESNNNIVVSLTSYGQRVELVHHTILSLLCQTVRPKKLILWLAESEFSLDSLPEKLTNLQQYGLEIAFCRDIRSYKKLIPTLERYPNSTIITFDDDVIYPVDHIEKLVATSTEYPNMVVCHLAHSITFAPAKGGNGETLVPYNRWPKGVAHSLPSQTLFPVGVGGVLYPAECLDDNVLNETQFMTLCPHADDIWFKLMALKKGTLTKLVDQPQLFKDYLHLPNTQKLSLWKINAKHNDTQLAAVLAAYPEVTFK